MSEHYPRIRVRVECGALLIREAVSSTFYMRHSHAEVAQAVLRSLELYRRAVHPQVGGVAGLRSRLSSPGTTVQELEAERAIITLGPWPEAGDTEQGKVLPAYRELARVLEPWLHQEKLRSRLPSDNEVMRWERRFLD